MSNRYAGESEFGGAGGMIQPRNIANGVTNGIEDLWTVYASDPNSTDVPDPRRVGDPASYVQTADTVSGVPPVDPVRNVSGGSSGGSRRTSRRTTRKRS